MMIDDGDMVMVWLGLMVVVMTLMMEMLVMEMVLW
jgi:hypothetical protein